MNSHTYNLLRQEMAEQEHKWGKDRVLHPDRWIAILGEEFGEVCRAVNERDKDNYMDELIDLAASALAAAHSLMLESLTDPEQQEDLRKWSPHR